MHLRPTVRVWDDNSYATRRSTEPATVKGSNHVGDAIPTVGVRGIVRVA